MEMTREERDTVIAITELIELSEFLAKSGRSEAKPIIEVILGRIHLFSQGKRPKPLPYPIITDKIASLVSKLGLRNPGNLIQ